MKKVLLIGASGYIGSELSKFLLKNYELTEVDNLRRKVQYRKIKNFFQVDYQSLMKIF